MLKRTVPASWTPPLHRSSRRRRAGSPSSATNAWRHWSAAAVVKKIDPTKNTSASTREPTSSTKPGSAPTVKQAAPTANSTPIHHEIRRGDHQAPTPRSSAPGQDERSSRPDEGRLVRRGHATAMPVLDVLVLDGRGEPRLGET